MDLTELLQLFNTMPSNINNASRYQAIWRNKKASELQIKNHADVKAIKFGGHVTKAHDALFLRELLDKKLADSQVIVVSNRQPFHHIIENGLVRLVQPASGLITALEPVVRACAGTWIAHGSGVNDRDFVDDHDRCPAPAGNGAYTLRRVWMTADEQRGYCDGFSNSGLWPLSHMAHVRPVLNESDWQHYAAINRRFADAVVQEARGIDPIVLVQDYHLSLVPALVRARLPRATIISFWHIPWPHPDQMSMCPWLPEILDGLLGCDVVGMQTPQHVQNFVELANRHEKNVRAKPVPQISHGSHTTKIRAYPISIAWPTATEEVSIPTVKQCRERVCKQFQLTEKGRLIIGVDRFDYTKGLIERLHAFETLLDIHPHWRSVVRFVQVASPTRIDLKEYTDYQLQVFREVERINTKFETAGVAPVVLLDSHHDRHALNVLYRAADVCTVTSLHDGMNLVCKEFAAARIDEQGVLVLSQFAGAANELRDALIVNPYHTLQIANALNQALTMPVDEQIQRMRALRTTVKKGNVYKWAADMLDDAISVRKPLNVHLKTSGSANRFSTPGVVSNSLLLPMRQDFA